MPAVLDRPLPLLAVLLGPAQQRQMIGRRRSQRLRAQLAAVFVDRDDGVAALVRVDPQYDHVFRLLAAGRGSDRSVGISQYGAVPRSSEATPAGPSASGGPHNEPVPPQPGQTNRGANPPDPPSLTLGTIVSATIWGGTDVGCGIGSPGS